MYVGLYFAQPVPTADHWQQHRSTACALQVRSDQSRAVLYTTVSEKGVQLLAHTESGLWGCRAWSARKRSAASTMARARPRFGTLLPVVPADQDGQLVP